MFLDGVADLGGVLIGFGELEMGGGLVVVVGKGTGWVMRARIGGWGDGMEHDAWRWVGLGLRGTGTGTGMGMGRYGIKIMIMRACDLFSSKHLALVRGVLYEFHSRSSTVPSRVKTTYIYLSITSTSAERSDVEFSPSTVEGRKENVYI